MGFIKKHKFLFTVLLILIGLTVVSVLLNLIACQSELKRKAPIGQEVSVFDTTMHVFSIGKKTDEKPTLVFLSGLGTPSPIADFYPLWSRLEDQYQIVVLERPGYGWSGSTKRERTTSNIVEESRCALQGAGISPPYFLIAHSLSGLEANLMANEYPDEVSGVVLLDSTSPELMLTESGSFSFTSDIVEPTLRGLGILRLLDAVSPQILEKQSWGSRNEFVNVSSEYKELDIMFVQNKYQNKMVRNERKMREENAKVMLEKPFPKDMPVTLIFAYQEEFEQYPEYREGMKMQENWVKSSNKGQVINITGRHYIHHYAPDEVCDIISESVPLP